MRDIIAKEAAEHLKETTLDEGFLRRAVKVYEALRGPEHRKEIPYLIELAKKSFLQGSEYNLIVWRTLGSIPLDEEQTEERLDAFKWLEFELGKRLGETQWLEWLHGKYDSKSPDDLAHSIDKFLFMNELEYCALDKVFKSAKKYIEKVLDVKLVTKYNAD